MYCPQCGQQQISDNTRFCSRCGLLIDGVANLIARGGSAPVMRYSQPLPKPLTAKRKGIRRGAKVMFTSGVLFPVFFAMAVNADHPGPLIVPFTVFIAGLAMLLYSVMLGDDTPLPPKQAKQPSRLGGLFGKNALPPAPQDMQMPNVGSHRVRTAELVNPPSVTENTTRLLDRDLER